MRSLFAAQIVFFVVFGYTAGVSFARAMELKAAYSQAGLLIAMPVMALPDIAIDI